MSKFTSGNISTVGIVKMVQPISKDHFKVFVGKPDFMYSFRPFFYFSRILGAMPFSISYDSNGQLKGPRVRLYDAVWFVMSICAYLFMMYIYYREEGYSDSSYPFILRMCFLLQSFIFYISEIIIIVMDLFNCRRIVDILKMFNKFDKEMVRFGVSLSHEKKHRNALVSCILVVSIALLYPIYSILAYESTFVENITMWKWVHIAAHNFVYFAFWGLLTAIFVFLMQSLHKRYAVVNSILRGQISKDTRETSTKIHEDEIIKTVKFVGLQHSCLTEIMDEINFCFSFKMITVIAAALMNTIATLYCLYRYTHQQNQVYRDLLLSSFEFQLLTLVPTLMVIYTANSVTCEGKQTFQIVHKIINVCYNPNVAQSLSHLSNQVEHHYPVATCGLFQYNWTLLFTMAAAATTYIAIVINY